MTHGAYGLDLGGHRLRLASGSTAERATIASIDVPCTVNVAPTRDATTAARIRVRSLKRELDFDGSFPTPDGARPSVDLFADLVRRVLSTCGSGVSPGGGAIAVPPAFTQRQRAALQAAAQAAGLSSVALVDDTQAVMLAHQRSLDDRRVVLVCSWGATAFGAGLFVRGSNGLRVVAQEGLRDLGGDDLDARLLEGVARQAGPSEGVDAGWAQLVRHHILRAKPQLASGESVEIPLPGKEACRLSLSPDSFEAALGPMLEQVSELVEGVTGGQDKPDVILLVGGMTDVPALRSTLRSIVDVPHVIAGEDDIARGAMRFAIARAPQETPGWVDLAPRPVAAPSTAPGASNEWAALFAPLLNAAQEDYERGDLEKALAAMDGAIEKIGTFSADLSRRLVQGYEDKGQLGAALAIIRHARRHAPRDRALVADVLRLARRAVDEARAEGRPRDALETVDGALEALPDGVRDHRDITASLRYLRGCTLGTLDQLADAEKDLAESVRLAPDSEPYREQLEVVRRALRGTGRALERRAGRKAKVSRNSPCPCGSGRKYKRCCGR